MLVIFKISATLFMAEIGNQPLSYDSNYLNLSTKSLMAKIKLSIIPCWRWAKSKIGMTAAALCPSGYNVKIASMRLKMEKCQIILN